MEPCRLGASDALHRLRDGTLTAEALVRSCLERIAEREPLIRAFAHLDPETALRTAMARDAPATRDGLCGMPVGIKDNCDTMDVPTAYGSARYAGHRPAADADCVAALRAAGSVILGKTATTEFAGAHPALTRNPRDPGSSPGGSSAGSAAAVADCMLPVAIGTQTAGSVIRPAAFCGIVGIKPSFGLILTRGIRPVAPSLDTVGTFGRTVLDAALLLPVLGSDPTLAIEPGDAFRPRIGICRTAAWHAAAPEVETALDDAASTLARAGCEVREHPLPDIFGAAIQAQAAVMGAETYRSTRRDLAAGHDGLGRETVEAATAGAQVTPDAEQAARDTLAAARAGFATALGSCDVLLSPSVTDEAPEGLDWTGDPLFNRLWTALGVPCLTLPFGIGRRGLPIGVQVVGHPRGDRRLVAAALWIESALGVRSTAAERA